MDEEPEIGTESSDPDDAPRRPGPGPGVVAFVAVLLLLALAIYSGIAQTAAIVLLSIGVPLALLWFVWNVFLRRLWRVRRIRNAQQKRELLEAALRDRDSPKDMPGQHQR
jgi:hypothetical protein